MIYVSFLLPKRTVVASGRRELLTQLGPFAAQQNSHGWFGSAIKPDIEITFCDCSIGIINDGLDGKPLCVRGLQRSVHNLCTLNLESVF